MKTIVESKVENLKFSSVYMFTPTAEVGGATCAAPGPRPGRRAPHPRPTAGREAPMAAGAYGAQPNSYRQVLLNRARDRQAQQALASVAPIRQFYAGRR